MENYQRMGKRLKRNLKFSNLAIDRDDLGEGEHNQPSLSSRLRSWLNSSSAKYAKDKRDAMSAVISLDELHRPLQAGSLCRMQSECRRQKRSYLQRLNARKRIEIAEKLAASELKQEARLNAIEAHAIASETTEQQHGAAIEYLIHQSDAQMEETNQEAEGRLQGVQENLLNELDGHRMVLEQARTESLTALEQNQIEADDYEQNETNRLKQELHQTSLAAQDRIDELKTSLSARIADLEAVGREWICT